MDIIFGNNDWSSVYKENNINIALNNFYKIVLDTTEKMVPKKYLMYYHKFPRLFSRELCTLIKTKNNIINYLNHSVLTYMIHHNKFSLIWKKCKLLTKLCYENRKTFRKNTRLYHTHFTSLYPL